MGEKAAEAPNLLQRIADVQVKYANHHRVAFPNETLKAIALVAKSVPYMDGDAYQTALDLLDETGAAVKAKRLIANNEISLVGLREFGEVVGRKTGRSLDDFIQ